MDLIGLSGRRRSLVFWCLAGFLIGRFFGSFPGRLFLIVGIIRFIRIISVLRVFGIVRIVRVIRAFGIVRFSVAVAVLSLAAFFLGILGVFKFVNLLNAYEVNHHLSEEGESLDHHADYLHGVAFIDVKIDWSAVLCDD